MESFSFHFCRTRFVNSEASLECSFPFCRRTVLNHSVVLFFFVSEGKRNHVAAVLASPFGGFESPGIGFRDSQGRMIMNEKLDCGSSHVCSCRACTYYYELACLLVPAAVGLAANVVSRLCFCVACTTTGISCSPQLPVSVSTATRLF